MSDTHNFRPFAQPLPGMATTTQTTQGIEPEIVAVVAVSASGNHLLVVNAKEAPMQILHRGSVLMAPIFGPAPQQKDDPKIMTLDDLERMRRGGR